MKKEQASMRKLFSVDDHIVEPKDTWTSRVPAKYRDVAPHVREEDGKEFWVYLYGNMHTPTTLRDFWPA